MIDYLHDCGIAGDDVLCPPSVAEVLGVLFARFAKDAAGDEFARRWLVHLAARGTYHALDRLYRADARAVAAAAHYPDAVRLLAARIPAGPIAPWDRDMLHFAGQGRAAYGRAGTVFALACRAGAAGRITDLGDPDVVLGDPRLQLHPLWRPRPGQRPSVAQLAWMTADTHAKVRRAGGWGRDAYEVLACPDAALAAQRLSKPVPTLDADAEIARRSAEIVDVINGFLGAIGSLHATPTAVPAQLAVAA